MNTPACFGVMCGYFWVDSVLFSGGFCVILEWILFWGGLCVILGWIPARVACCRHDCDEYPRLFWGGKGNSNSHGARPVHLIITMMKWIRTSRLSIKARVACCRHHCDEHPRLFWGDLCLFWGGLCVILGWILCYFGVDPILGWILCYFGVNSGPGSLLPSRLR